MIYRRYWLGIENLFKIFVPIVDSWSLYDNSVMTVPIVVQGEVVDEDKLKIIKEICLNRKK